MADALEHGELGRGQRAPSGFEIFSAVFEITRNQIHQGGIPHELRRAAFRAKLPVERIEKLLSANRLGDLRVAACVHGILELGRAGDMTAQNDDRHVRPVAAETADGAGAVDTAHSGHLEVEENGVERLARDPLESRAPAFRLLELIGRLVEQQPDDHPHLGRVIDQKDAAQWVLTH